MLERELLRLIQRGLDIGEMIQQRCREFSHVRHGIPLHCGVR
jgi:hypothetical protein